MIIHDICHSLCCFLGMGNIENFSYDELVSSSLVMIEELEINKISM